MAIPCCTSPLKIEHQKESGVLSAPWPLGLSADHTRGLTKTGFQNPDEKHVRSSKNPSAVEGRVLGVVPFYWHQWHPPFPLLWVVRVFTLTHFIGSRPLCPRDCPGCQSELTAKKTDNILAFFAMAFNSHLNDVQPVPDYEMFPFEFFSNEPKREPSNSPQAHLCVFAGTPIR